MLANVHLDLQIKLCYHGCKQALISEIEAYRTNLNSVKEQGEGLMAANQHQPALLQQTETQLANLEDSYASLQATATQIKVSL